MLRSEDKAPAVRVYTVCDESKLNSNPKYLIVRNVPAIGCREELSKLFSSYGCVEECKRMDGEHCEPFTESYLITFQHVDNARFAKRKLDEVAFFGKLLQVSYAPEFETFSDTKEKLEGRRKEVLARLGLNTDSSQKTRLRKHSDATSSLRGSFPNHVSSDKDYFASSSMNKTVQLVRDKLDKIASSGDTSKGPELKKPRIDNRRRI